MISTIGKPSLYDPARRRFLAGAGATVALSATSSTRARASVPLKAMVYPIDQPTSGPYPEQTNPLYSASSGKWGVSFSGGGSRAFSAALGQMRGLTAANVLGNVGAISCVSGGTWFGAPYTFASASISDTELLGPLVQPGDLKVDSLKAESQFPRLAALMDRLKDDYIQNYLEAILPRVYKYKTLPSDKIYSRMLNLALLEPYNLSNTNTQFTLDQASLATIRNRNPQLTTSFHLARQGRPFFIAGGTQIISQKTPSVPAEQVDATTQIFHSIEYTPLYVGAPQFSPYIPTTYDYGGGYVESFAFNTTLSQPISNNIATVPVGTFPFLLSDLVGSSSAAPEAMFEAHFHTGSGGFPQFDYWPISPPSYASAPAATTQYSFGDGGILEDTGVVALLRRGYRTIFAFVNSNFPLGSKKSGTYGGIAEEVSQLFGYPEGNPQSTQVFSQAQFQPLVDGLIQAQKAGPAVYADTYPVMYPNNFGVAPYSPRIFWIYNGPDTNWLNSLTPPVAKLLGEDKYLHGLEHFPYYETVFQNPGELVYLTPLQVHLLADMWAYSVHKGFAVPGSAFGAPIG